MQIHIPGHLVEHKEGALLNEVDQWLIDQDIRYSKFIKAQDVYRNSTQCSYSVKKWMTRGVFHYTYYMRVDVFLEFEQQCEAAHFKLRWL